MQRNPLCAGCCCLNLALTMGEPSARACPYAESHTPPVVTARGGGSMPRGDEGCAVYTGFPAPL